MLQFILRRLGLVIPTFIGITLLTFAFVHMIPGDPVTIMAGERGISAERHAQLMAEMGLDKPLYQQYFSYVSNVLHGDLGTSLQKPHLRLERVRSALSGHAGAGPVRDDLRGAGGHPGRGAGGGQTRLGLRPYRGGHLADRLFDADFLVGHDADHAGVGAA
ncbi:hypothetical protein IC615_05160 [Serratia ureilytica]